MRINYQCESYNNGVWYNTSGTEVPYGANGFIRPDGKIQAFPSNQGEGSTNTVEVDIGVDFTQSYSIPYDYV